MRALKARALKARALTARSLTTLAMQRSSLLLLALLAACSAPAERGIAPADAQATALTLSVAPGINDTYLDPTLDVDGLVERFEGESREVYVHRERIAEWTGLCDGMRVADIGAGTGLFTVPFAQRVGDEGKVFAVEIAPRLVEHLESVARAKGMTQVQVVEGGERDVRLPDHSVQVAFVCDTYHHFEYPAETLRSIHRAIVPNGELLIIDFERIEGVTRPWILGHVRAGREVVIAEIEAAGFKLTDQASIPGLVENYALRFRRL